MVKMTKSDMRKAGVSEEDMGDRIKWNSIIIDSKKLGERKKAIVVLQKCFFLHTFYQKI